MGMFLVMHFTVSVYINAIVYCFLLAITLLFVNTLVCIIFSYTCIG